MEVDGKGRSIDKLIQGIVKEYKVTSGGKVNAGDFVKFISYKSNLNIIDAEIDKNEQTAFFIGAVALSETRIFMVHPSSYGYGSYGIFGKILTINENNISIGNNVRLSDSYLNNVNKSVRVVKLTENKVVVFYNTSNEGGVRTAICTINGNSITSNDTLLIKTQYSGYKMAATKLSENKIFLVHIQKNYSTYNLVAAICTIEDTSISVGVDVALNLSVSTTDDNIPLVEALNENNVIVSTRQSNGVKLCTITNDVIEIKKSTSISYFINSMARLSENEMFLACSSGSNFELFGVICRIVENEIVSSAGTQLSTLYLSGYDTSVIKVSESEVFIAFSNRDDYNDYYLHGMYCTITTDKILVDEVKQLSNKKINRWIMSTVALNKKSVFVAFSSYENPSRRIIWLFKWRDRSIYR